MKTINHRQKQKTYITTAGIIIGVLIVTLSVVYAALSTTLNISGSSTINASNWDIAINNSTTSTNTTTGSATYTTPTISGTTISYGASFTKPSDSVSLYFDVSNTGDISGEITSIVTSTPECTSVTGNAADAKLVCDNLEISLTYSDGSPISIGDVVNTNGSRCLVGTTTSSNNTYIKLVVKLKDAMTTLPSSQVNVTNLKHDIIYSQTEKTCTTSYCFTAGTKVAAENGYKNIEDISVGEYVYSYNLETKIKELKQVTKTFKHQKDEIYTLKVNNQYINTTEEHPFYVVNKGWTTVKDLNFNSQLLSLKNKETKIQSINKHNFKNTYVYNIEVEDNHNYLITEQEFLVHNKVTTPTEPETETIHPV